MTTHTAFGAAGPAAISFLEILPSAIFGGLFFALGVYFVGVERGATALFDGAYAHELVHDGRRLLGFPCH
jgi:hypothetical protein